MESVDSDVERDEDGTAIYESSSSESPFRSDESDESDSTVDYDDNM